MGSSGLEALPLLPPPPSPSPIRERQRSAEILHQFSCVSLCEAGEEGCDCVCACVRVGVCEYVCLVWLGCVCVCVCGVCVGGYVGRVVYVCVWHSPLISRIKWAGRQARRGTLS